MPLKAFVRKRGTPFALAQRMRVSLLKPILDAYLPLWAEHERVAHQQDARRLPRESVHAFRISGLLLSPVPIALGGLGADLWDTCEGLRELARAAPSTALCLAMPLGNAANTRIEDAAVAPDKRKALAAGRTWIAEKCREGAILAVANSEPGAGGDLHATKTRAVRRAEHIYLTGKKSFATLGPDADYFLCSARTEADTVDAFFVARQQKGVQVLKDWNALGMRATASVGLVLENARTESVFVYEGAIDAVSARHWSTLLIASVFVGIGEGALQNAVQTADKKSAYVRTTLAECALRLDAARGFVETLAQTESVPCTPQYLERCRRAKTFAAQTSLESATRALTVCGGRAYRPDHPTARLWLDAAAGPLLRPPLPQALDAIAAQLLD